MSRRTGPTALTALAAIKALPPGDVPRGVRLSTIRDALDELEAQVAEWKRREGGTEHPGTHPLRQETTDA